MGGWERKTNRKLNESPINIMRKPVNRMPRKLLASSIGGRKKQRRPRSEVGEDIGWMNIDYRREKIRYRREWRVIGKEAMNLLDLLIYDYIPGSLSLSFLL